ncbi:Dabb family protein [Membranihabitans marinus]|uniref:Dabb family protein n=1 Tax=Membranihabitans marinus TaxID=1227546 RepID=UPI001F17A456|nr:Dabb family protein [Membranihabitans marinus]
MIKHTVFFKLKHELGSVEEEAFLEKAKALSSISTIQSFELVKEISPKNNFNYGLVIQFEDQAGYDIYNQHPQHTQFVKEVWIPEVEEFLEIDYI